MLGDAKLNSLDTRLEQFKLTNATSQHELQKLLKEYSQLLDDYKSLKSSPELKSNGVTIAGSAAPTKPRNSYVFVLVDGNGYIFNDELIKEKEEGGMRAARMLNDVVEKYLLEFPQTKSLRTVVRIYADFTNLSKQLAKNKLIGMEKRSLAPFAAGFTRAISHFDFIDALDEEGTRFKVRESFKMAAEDSACHHILFAGCHDTSYLPQLVPYNGHQNKLTLVQGAGFETDFYQIGLNVAQFPTVFRWSELALSTSATKGPAANTTAQLASHSKVPTSAYYVSKQSPLELDSWRSNPISPDGIAYDTNGVINNIPDFTSDSLPTSNQAGKKTKVCKYFQKGFCRYGNKCNFIHASDTLIPSSQASSANLDRNVSSHLPTSIPVGFIPLNKDDHRIDTYVRPPTAEEWLIYNARFHKQKPCNTHHLAGTCTNFNCPFDHHPLEVESQHCLEDCFHGHLCQKDGCTGQIKGCKMKGDLHAVDPKLASMVPAVVEDESVHGDLISVGTDYTDAW
ncbi:hypothetical protein N0V90_007415 [Kalmusia sp. IMI 367209]|nr:hypothetical protein N0V90_007415 [Kalmusia sp. IMI 367209]